MASQLAITIERMERVRPRGRVAHLDALLLVGAAVLVLEFGLVDLDHGTHLLVGLLVVIGAAVTLGPGPATSGLVVGAGTSVAAPMLAVGSSVPIPLTYLQLAAYLVAGGLIIILASRAIRARAPLPSRAVDPQASAPPPGLVEPLTSRETDILRLAASGIPVDEIAARLFLSPNTVKTHLAHAYAKLGVRGRSDAIRAALHYGCLSPSDICPHRFAGGDGGAPPLVAGPHRPER